MWGDISLWFWLAFPWWLVNLDVFSFICLLFVRFLLRNVYSGLLPIFQLGYLCFDYWAVWASWSVLCCMLLILENSWPLLPQVSLLFCSLFLLVLKLHVWSIFWFCSTVLRCSVFFHSFFSLHFIGVFLLTYFQVYWFFPQQCQVYWWAHQRHSLLLLLCFWFLAFPFDSFLEFPSLCL